MIPIATAATATPMTPAVASTIAPSLVTVSTLTISAIVVLGWVLLEALILFSNIGQKVLAQLFCALNIVGIGSTMRY